MKRGFGLVVLIFIMMVFSVLAAGFVSLLFSETRLMIEELNYTRALRIAEAGHSFGLQRLYGYSDWSQAMGFPLTRSFAGGSFTIATSNEAGDEVILTSTGSITISGKQYQRTVRSTVSVSRGTGFIHDFDYAMYAGPPSGGATLRIEGSAQLHGDFLYNGPIRLGGSASQSGGIIYSTSLSVYGSATYASWETVPSLDLPIWDNSAYDAYLDLAETSSASSLFLGSGQTLNLNGRTLFYRNIVIGWGSTIIGPGRLVATDRSLGFGNISLSYGAGVGQGIKFIAARYFTYFGGSSLTNSIEVYANDLVTVSNNLSVPRGSILYSKSVSPWAIYIGGSVNANLLAPYGRVYMDYGAIRGLIYANALRTANSGEIRGGIIVGLPSSIQGSIQIYYDPAYLPDGLSGLGGTGGVSAEAGLSVTNWQEVF